MKATSRIGVAIEATSFRAVETVGLQPKWFFELDRDPDQPFGEALSEFLCSCPSTTRLRRRSVDFALPADYALLKRLAGFPIAASPELLRDIVNEDVSRFFVTEGVRPLLGGVRLLENGEFWVAAYDATAVEAVAKACARAGLRVGALVPTVSVLSSALVDEEIVWPERASETHVRYDSAGEICEVRRTVLAPIDISQYVSRSPDSPQAVEELAAAAPEAWRFAAAYGAALSASAEPTRLDVAAQRSHAGGRLRIALPATACGIAILFAAFAPGAYASYNSRLINRELAALSAKRAESAAQQAVLRQNTRSLDELSRFDRGRRPTTQLLAAIAAHLPERTALSAFHVDSASGSLVVVGSRVALVVPALEQIQGIAAPEIVGPVTRERPAMGSSSAGTQLADRADIERMTVRFRRQLKNDARVR